MTAPTGSDYQGGQTAPRPPAPGKHAAREASFWAWVDKVKRIQPALVELRRQLTILSKQANEDQPAHQVIKAELAELEKAIAVVTERSAQWPEMIRKLHQRDFERAENGRPHEHKADVGRAMRDL